MYAEKKKKPSQMCFYWLILGLKVMLVSQCSKSCSFEPQDPAQGQAKASLSGLRSLFLTLPGQLCPHLFCLLEFCIHPLPICEYRIELLTISCTAIVPWWILTNLYSRKKKKLIFNLVVSGIAYSRNAESINKSFCLKITVISWLRTYYVHFLSELIPNAMHYPVLQYNKKQQQHKRESVHSIN